MRSLRFLTVTSNYSAAKGEVSLNRRGFLPAVEMTGMVGRHVELRYEGNILRNSGGSSRRSFLTPQNDGNGYRHFETECNGVRSLLELAGDFSVVPPSK
ncbi:MAG: hypothetical protein RIC03_19380 [Cyclobacteriaceae bacterium]